MAKLPFFIILICSAVPEIMSHLHCRKSPQHAAVFIFGDSFFDAGNNNYINTTTLDQANFWPYGETFFHYPTGRFSDGRLISDFIAEYAKLPVISPYLQPRKRNYQNNYYGVNFASAGAGVLPDTFQGLVIDLRTQLKYYKREVGQLSSEIGHSNSSTILSSAVYLFSIGTNDYISPFLLHSTLLSSYSHSQYVEMVIGNLSIILKGIYKTGGRKFGFMNLGELGCLPGLRILRHETEGRCLKEASDLAQLHNTALHKMLSKMEQQLHGFKYFIYDFNTNLNQKITQPLQHGFEEGKKACCGTGRFNGIFSCGGKRQIKKFEVCENPSEFVFWDSYHLTERVYKQMAAQMWNTGTKKLFQCF